MKHLLFLLLFPFAMSAQYVDTWANVSTLKSMAILTPGQEYMLTDLGKIIIVANSATTFYPTPKYRTPHAMEYDYETFDFDSKQITGYDNIHGICRNNGAWYLLNDAGHKSYKVQSVSGNLTIHFTKAYDKVISFQTTLDDAYSASNHIVSCGVSVGYSSATILFHKTVIGLNGALIKTPMTLQELNILGSAILFNATMSKNIQL